MLCFQVESDNNYENDNEVKTNCRNYKKTSKFFIYNILNENIINNVAFHDENDNKHANTCKKNPLMR